MSSPLAVALDATLWDEPLTGISRYAHCLAGALEHEDVRVSLLGAARSGESPRGSSVGATAFVTGVLPGLLARRDEPIFHALGNFNLPLARVSGKRFVLTVHDLIPELFPETVSLAYRTQFRTWLSRSLQIADQVICVSHATEADLRRLHPGFVAPVRVIHHGVDHVPAQPADAEAERWVASLALPAEVVLYAGALDARKNVSLLLSAMERLWTVGRKTALVLVGQRWFGSDPVERRVEQLRAQDRDVRPLGHQSSPRLYALMRAASAFVFPSRYEGFGLPPLEAMRLGTPVIVARTGALPEVCGDAALYTPEDDPEELAAVLTRLLDSPEERRWRSEAGRSRAETFTWKDAARATRDAYAELLRG